jgi:hypothetical protein
VPEIETLEVTLEERQFAQSAVGKVPVGQHAQYGREQIETAFRSVPACICGKERRNQDIGLYTIKRQSPTNNTGRNYIRGRVDEKGRMTLVSQWSGSYYIHHNRIRLSANDSYVDSPVSDDRHEFTDLGVCYEWLSFVNGNDGGMAAFIAANRDAKTIRYTVSGRDSRNPERDYSVNLNLGKDDITAIAQLYDLSQILLSLEEHKNILAEAERHLQFIRSRIKEDPAEESAQTE